MPRTHVPVLAGELIEALDIGDWASTMGQRLSGGIKRLVGFSMVTVWPGRVVILDEPTAALGVTQTRVVLELIQRLKGQGIAIIVISHNLTDVMAVADRVPVVAERTAVLSVPYDGRPACHYCGQCNRGCATHSNFSSPSVLLPPASGCPSPR